MEPILKELGARTLFISENGGAFFIPRAYFPFAVDFHGTADGYGVIRLEARYSALTSTLDSISRNLRISIWAFHQMTEGQIAEETGLPYWKAELARAREYDEPFVFTNETTPDVNRFRQTVELLGLRWTRGGRFDHLLGHAGKRPAVSILTSLYRRWNPEISIAGLGNSANDTGMLSAVDVAILVQKPGGGYDPVVTHAIPGVQRSPLPGPRAWTASVTHLLAELDGFAGQCRRADFLARLRRPS
jgi:mannosyl-3-phosphoglycerate phosphatase